MESVLIRTIDKCLDEYKRAWNRSNNRHMEIQQFSSWLLKQGACVNGKTYYNVRKPESSKLEYLGSQTNETVIRIQEERYLREQLTVLERDIQLMEDFLEQYESVSFENITARLPKVYRNDKALSARDKRRVAASWKYRKEKEKAKYPPYKPEELKHRTVDGNYVRSKSEAAIYNYLYEAGYTFVYELPLEGNTRRFFPDFTILSEIDYTTEVRIEHHGMMDDSGYRNNAEAREYDYWYNGYLPGRDVYFTYDDNRGALDITPIMEILNSRVRPLGSQAES